MRDTEITETSLQFFKELAGDANDWDGTPLLGGNVVMTKELRGNLTQLKHEGLLITEKADGHDWIRFTEKGRDFARELGIWMSDDWYYAKETR